LSEKEIVLEGRILSLPGIVVHGGAGTFERVRTPEEEAVLAEALEAALKVGWSVLDTGGRAMEGVVAAVRSLEESGVFNAGRSGARTEDGRLEMDASVMDGESGVFGGIAAATWPRSPVEAARALADLGGPAKGPVLLAGEGADEFARRSGIERMRAEDEVGDERKESGSTARSESGTVGAVGVDAKGHVAGATSTGGREGQLHGRVGDSPLPGAGTWADDETVAVSATGEGESFAVAGFGHRVDWELRAGSSLEVAVRRSLMEVRHRGGSGGAITVTRTGESVWGFDTRAMARGWMDGSTQGVRVLGRSE
jgi:isoaspartyl peptidase/L-asparaginase-like protein (Ntn-hydrolase superfamily)